MGVFVRFGQLHGGGFLFTGAAAGFRTPKVDRNMNGGPMKPTEESRFGGKFGSGAGEAEEDGLGGFLRERFAVQAALRDRENKVGVAADQLLEGWLGPSLAKFGQ